jgi:hypothetical protein
MQMVTRFFNLWSFHMANSKLGIHICFLWNPNAAELDSTVVLTFTFLKQGLHYATGAAV